MIYHIFANKTNIGDWVSALGIQSLLREYNLDVKELYCDDYWIEETSDKLLALNGNSTVIVGGGGLVMDYFSPLWETLDKLAMPRLVIWGIGVCDLKDGTSLSILPTVRRVVQRAALCRVRDAITSDKIGQPEQTPTVLCPSMNWIAQEPLTSKGIIYSVHKAAVAEDVSNQLKQTVTDFGVDTARPVHCTDHRIEHANRGEMDGILALYRQSDIVVTSRLHACIIGVAMGRHVLAVSGDWKIEAFMQAVGLSQWVLDRERVSQAGDLLARIQSQHVDREKIGRILAGNLDVAKCIASEIVG